MLALERLTGLVVIDEAQLVPDLFPTLRVLVDRPERPSQFLVLGSASPDLVGLTAESLAGRVELLELSGLRLADVADDTSLWIRGGLPRSFDAGDEGSAVWRRNYIDTFLHRDLGSLGLGGSPARMGRMWTMLAHYHGQQWNGAELARALGVSNPTVRSYLDALTDALVVRQLQPWFANVGKRVVKSPKVYIRDSGLLHTLLGLETLDDVLNHPKVGASWEGFVLEQLALHLGSTPLYFWATHGGGEVDVVFERRGRRIGVEIKRTSTPKIQRSMRSAIDDISLDRLYVVYPGRERFDLAADVEAIPLGQLTAAVDVAIGDRA